MAVPADGAGGIGAFIISAAERGAAAANYVRARHVIVEQGKVAGAELTDQRTGNNFRLRARMVLNAAGPWCEDLAPVPNGRGSAIPRRWAQGVNLVLNRPALPVAVGIRSRWNSERDPILGGHRYLFMTGWKGVTLAGTSYRFATGAPSLAIQAEELIEEWNAACPSMQLAVQEITQAHLGLLPLRDGVQPGRPTALLDQSAIVEHQGMSGFLTLVSTKFSTARHLAEQAVDKAMVTLGRGRGASPARHVPLTLPGTDAPELDRRTRHAIREEMACTLEDLVLRRLGLGLTAIPPVSLLGRIADTAAEELGWTRREADDEIKRLLVAFFPASVTRAA